MKKATKVIVSGLTGFALLTGGFVVGAQKDWKIWQGEAHIEQTEKNIETLDRMLGAKEELVGKLEKHKEKLAGEITNLKTQKGTLDSKVTELEGLQTRILDGAKALSEAFLPGSSSKITIENIASWSDQFKTGSGPVKESVDAEFVALENTLDINPTGSYSQRLDAIQAEAIAVVSELNETEEKLATSERVLEEKKAELAAKIADLNTANSEISRLEKELDTKDSDAKKLQKQLDKAEKDAEKIKEKSQRVIDKHSKKSE